MSLLLDLQIEIKLEEQDREAIEGIRPVLMLAARLEKQKNVEVSLLIVDNEQIQQLNQSYRQKDQPTDVLSFPQWTDDEEKLFFPVEEKIPLGDVIISLPKAREQAEELGHSLKRELSFLAVHGFLHLLGYDHQTEDERKIMFQKQEEILQKAGLPR